LRVEKMAKNIGEEKAAIYIDIAKTFIYDAADRIHKSGKDALMAFTEDDELRMMLMGMRRFTKVAPLASSLIHHLQ
jgi:hypothetical protein